MEKRKKVMKERIISIEIQHRRNEKKHIIHL